MEHFDQILIDEHFATEDQINEARERSRRAGGTLDEHLFRLGHVSKTELLQALARRHGCNSIDPGRLDIPDHVAQMIPATIAWKLRVLPFHHDPGANVLKIVCASPPDEEARCELQAVVPDCRMEYHVTLRSLLDCKLIETYRGAVDEADESAPAERDTQPRGNYLMVTSFPEADQYLAMALGAEDNRVVIVDSVEEALSEVDSDRFSAILIRDTDSSQYRPLIDRCRMLSLSTPVRVYSSIGTLAGSDGNADGGTRLLAANLRLCISLLCSEEDLSAGRISPMGSYVERVCRQLRLPSHDRMLITNAAYLHDLARLYLGDTEATDWQSAFAMQSQNGGDSFVFPPTLLEMLRLMNQSEPGKYPDRLPLEALGAIILKLVDYYLQRWPNTDKVSLKQFEAVRQHLRDRSNVMFPEQIVEAFLVVLNFDTVDSTGHGQVCDVLLYSPDGRDTLLLEPCLKNIGFEVLLAGSLDSFVEIYESAWPDFLVILAPGSADEAADIVSAAIGRGVMIDRVPTFLLAESSQVTDLHFLLQSGLEDVIPFDGDLDPLLVKLNRIRSRHEAEQRDRLTMIQNVGTHGTLEDMNAIDLLQAMGHSQKTVRISVTGNGRQLTIYLNQGAPMYAVCDDLVGADAVYDALGWRTGVWSVDPISADSLPEPNIFESIDSLLIEGCRRIDEESRGGNDVEESQSLFQVDQTDSLF